jgi:hypothetical protein
MKIHHSDTIVQFWRRLNGSLHPDDAPAMSNDSRSKEFELSYPPPAFIGDIKRASIFVLMANGGRSDDVRLAKEFESAKSVKEYIARLHKPRPAEPGFTSPYYQRGKLWEYLRSGKACVVNALAYRSREVTTDVRQIAELLPSVLLHRSWLIERAIPAARRREIAIIAKRPGLWRFDRTAYGDSPLKRILEKTLKGGARQGQITLSTK